MDQNNKMLDIIKSYQEKESESQNQLISLFNDDKVKNERILSIIEYYVAQTAKLENVGQVAISTDNESNPGPTDYIDAATLNLNIPVKEDDYIDRKTVRVSYRIYENFNDLCKAKFPRYKQQDLVSLALQDFIDKYNKKQEEYKTVF